MEEILGLNGFDFGCDAISFNWFLRDRKKFFFHRLKSQEKDAVYNISDKTFLLKKLKAVLVIE